MLLHRLSDLEAASAVDLRQDVVTGIIDALLISEPGYRGRRDARHVTLQSQSGSFRYVDRTQVSREIWWNDLLMRFC